MVEDEVVAEGAKEQIEGECSEVGDDEEAEQLAKGLVLWPARGVHVGCEQVVVSDLQHQVHGGSGGDRQVDGEEALLGVLSGGYAGSCAFIGVWGVCELSGGAGLRDGKAGQLGGVSGAVLCEERMGGALGSLGRGGRLCGPRGKGRGGGGRQDCQPTAQGMGHRKAVLGQGMQLVGWEQGCRGAGLCC